MGVVRDVLCVRTERYCLQTLLFPQMYNCLPVLAEKLPKTIKCFGKIQGISSQKSSTRIRVIVRNKSQEMV
jgi:hypothetical protein